MHIDNPCIWGETPLLKQNSGGRFSRMAHHPIFGPDPAKPAWPVAEGSLENGAGPAATVTGESDLAEMAAMFAQHVSPELAAGLALEIVLNEIVQQACLATGASGAAIVLERAGEWVCRATAGSNAPQLGAKLDAAAGLSGACMKTRKLQRCDDAQSDARADMEASRQLGVRSVIILPLLRNDELAGVFEVFSPWPAAFGERDERTLEALSQRVLKNLERASETLTLAARVEPAEAAPSKLKTFGEGRVGADYGSADGTERQTGSDAGSRRGINLITGALGVGVLAFTVLLTVRASQRLVRGNSSAFPHPSAAVSTSQTSAENPSAVVNERTTVSGTPVAGGSESAATGSSGILSDKPPTGSSSVAPAAGTHAASASPAAGSLLVYENGKEVFRMPPAGERGEAAEASSMIEGGLIHRVEPGYPEEARRQQIQGQVVLDVRAGRDGRVQEVKLVSGPQLLADAAIAAVKHWQFSPQTVGGKPIEMQTRVTLNFRLPTEDKGR
jgi:TonB family protein